MPKFNHRGIVIGLVAVIALLLSITVPTALAGDDQEQEFAMLDDFATEDGASGSGESEVDGDFVEVAVDAEGLLPYHQYEMKVTIGPCTSPAIADCDAPIVGMPAVVTCGWENSDSDGEVEFDCDLDLVELLGPGTYRLDFFVTHIHPTDPAGNPQGGDPDPGVILPLVLDRDPLLRCSPASRHSF